MDEAGPPPEARELLAPAKLAAQLLGFAVGLALLGWIVRNALREGDWQRIAGAGPVPVILLACCTLASALLNGATFWVTIRPVRRLRFWDLQRINVIAALLNYAPLRLGAIVRVVHHLRADGLSLLQVGAWFGLVGYALALTAASCAVATFAHPRLDLIWGLFVAVQLWLGGLALRLLVSVPLAARHGRGIDVMAKDGAALWGAIGLRLADVAVCAGRMAVAARVLEIDLEARQTVLLGLVAIAAGLIPFGRLGFREFCVAAAASQLGLAAGEAEAHLNQLALVESAGEAIVSIPLGAASLFWLRGRWRRGAGR